MVFSTVLTVIGILQKAENVLGIRAMAVWNVEQQQKSP